MVINNNISVANSAKLYIYVIFVAT